MTSRDWRRGLLVSVRDVTEALAAAAGGADIIDVKEPARGPLGRADAAVTAAIVAAVAGRASVTLACGELAAGSDEILAHVDAVLAALPAGAAPPVAVKAGPAGMMLARWRASFAALASRLPAGIEPVAVAYADHPAVPVESVLEVASEAGAATLLIDTCDKQGPGLPALVAPEQLRAWVARASEAGVVLAVAGRLTAAEAAGVLAMGVPICGVRTAACEGGRQGCVSAPLVRSLATLCQRSRSAVAEPSGRR